MLIGLLRLLFEGGDFITDDADLLFDGLCLLGFALAHEGSDLLGKGLALGLESLFFGLGFAASFVVGEDFVHEGIGTTSSCADAVFDEFRIFAKELDIEHYGAV